MSNSGKRALTGWIPSSKDHIELLKRLQACPGVYDVMIEAEADFPFKDLENEQVGPTVCSFSIVGDEDLIIGLQKE